MVINIKYKFPPLNVVSWNFWIFPQEPQKSPSPVDGPLASGESGANFPGCSEGGAELLILPKSKQSRGWLNQIAPQQWIQFRQRLPPSDRVYILIQIYIYRHIQTLVYQWLSDQLKRFFLFYFFPWSEAEWLSGFHRPTCMFHSILHQRYFPWLFLEVEQKKKIKGYSAVRKCKANKY